MALTEITHLSDEMQTCTDNCFTAAQATEWCADECIGTGDMEMARCARLCRDVSDLTTLHARFMARNSDYHPELAEICAEACETCADVCEQFDAEHCQVCVPLLRECAESCRRMATT